MRCLFCDRQIDKYDLRSLFLERDELCISCRSQLKVRHRYLDLGAFRVECFYEYEGIFRSLLLQYKECGDEALKKVFLYGLKDHLNIRYFGYKMMLVPSSKRKLESRGFDHLAGIFEGLRLERAGGLKMVEELSQEGKSFFERAKMADNYVYEGEKLDKVLIVDDVVTTGSTLRGVYRSIFEHAKIVKVLSLAYKSSTLH